MLLPYLSGLAVLAAPIPPAPGTAAFLDRYAECLAEIGSWGEIGNCAAWETAMQEALETAWTEAKRKAATFEKELDLQPPRQVPLASMLENSQSSWHEYDDAACNPFLERELFGLDGQWVQAPLCRMQNKSDRLRTLRAFNDY